MLTTRPICFSGSEHCWKIQKTILPLVCGQFLSDERLHLVLNFGFISINQCSALSALLILRENWVSDSQGCFADFFLDG